MAQKSKRSVLLAAIESTYGTDAVPTVAANAMLASNIKVTPMNQDMVERKNAKIYMGKQGKIPGSRHMELTFDTELAGSGTAGTAPACGVLMKACAMQETIVALTSAAYSPVSTGEQSATIYYNVDGLQYKMLGARGSFSLKFSQKGVPMISWKFVGLFGGIADVAIAAPTLTAWKDPVAFTSANSTPVTLHGLAAKFSEITLDIGNSMAFRPLIGTEDVSFGDRGATGKATFENPAIATKDFWTIINAGTLGALSLTHGQTAGNKVIVAGPSVQLSAPGLSSADNIEMLGVSMDLLPTAAGNDELTITFE